MYLFADHLLMAADQESMRGHLQVGQRMEGILVRRTKVMASVSGENCSNKRVLQRNLEEANTIRVISGGGGGLRPICYSSMVILFDGVHN